MNGWLTCVNHLVNHVVSSYVYASWVEGVPLHKCKQSVKGIPIKSSWCQMEPNVADGANKYIKINNTIDMKDATNPHFNIEVSI